jgi:hypothetical protein
MSDQTPTAPPTLDPANPVAVPEDHPDAPVAAPATPAQGTLFNQDSPEAQVVSAIASGEQVPAPADYQPNPAVANIGAEVKKIEDSVDHGDLHELYASAPAVWKESKNGLKTTEFWLGIAGLVAVNLNGVVMTLPDKWQAVGSAVIVGLYAISRGVAKSGVADPKPELPEA